MDHPMSKEESYANRRKLFKDIWDTAMHLDNKDQAVLNKPKVIKTLHLDEVDRCVAGKRQKQRIKNLRAVCNRLLDFCDLQESTDWYYEKMLSQIKSAHNNESISSLPKLKKTKHSRKPKQKIRKAKSMISPIKSISTNNIRSNEKEETVVYTSRNTSPIKIKQASCTYKNKIRNKHKRKTSTDLLKTPAKVKYLKKLRKLGKGK